MNKQAGGSIGFIGFLTLILITLKLIGSIDWSWIFVLSPIWFPFVVLIAASIFWVCIEEICDLWKKRDCIFKGHDFITKYEQVRLSYGYASKPVTRCTKCGAVKKSH